MRNHRVISRVVAAGLVSAVAFPAAANDGALWVAPVVLVCLATTPALAATPLGERVTAEPQFMRTLARLKTPGAETCLAQKEWLDPGLCPDLMNRDPDGALPEAEFYARHGRDISGLQTLFKCVESGERAGPVSQADVPAGDAAR